MKNNKSLEHLNVLLRIFFVSGVFQNLMSIFGLYKRLKSACPKAILAEKNFSSKFYFLSSIWIFKLSASRITENSSHCYCINVDLNFVYSSSSTSSRISSKENLDVQPVFPQIISSLQPGRYFNYFLIILWFLLQLTLFSFHWNFKISVKTKLHLLYLVTNDIEKNFVFGGWKI